jgi:hypothetical protein
MSASLQKDGEEISSKETTSHRSDADIDMSSPEQIPTVAATATATATATAALSADYAQIAKLFAQLDQQVGTFTSNMDNIIQTAPAMDGLTTLWEEQAKAASTNATSTTLGAPQADADSTDNNDIAMLLGDDAENTTDPLVFL